MGVCEDMSDEWCEGIGECNELGMKSQLSLCVKNGVRDQVSACVRKGFWRWVKLRECGMSDVRVCVYVSRVCVVNGIKD